MPAQAAQTAFEIAPEHLRSTTFCRQRTCVESTGENCNFWALFWEHAGLLGFPAGRQLRTCQHTHAAVDAAEARNKDVYRTFFWVRLSLPWLFEAMGRAEANIWMFVSIATAAVQPIMRGETFETDRP